MGDSYPTIRPVTEEDVPELPEEATGFAQRAT